MYNILDLLDWTEEKFYNLFGGIFKYYILNPTLVLFEPINELLNLSIPFTKDRCIRKKHRINISHIVYTRNDKLFLLIFMNRENLVGRIAFTLNGCIFYARQSKRVATLREVLRYDN